MQKELDTIKFEYRYEVQELMNGKQKGQTALF